MENIQIKFDGRKKTKRFLDRGLDQYNYSKNQYLNPKIYEKIKYFGFYAYANKKIIGGVYGFIDDGYWTRIELFYISESYRNIDIGTKLINFVEKFSEDFNCIGILVNTWSFQAKGFYEKMGFTIFAQLENHPPETKDYYLKKILIKDKKIFPKPIK